MQHEDRGHAARCQTTVPVPCHIFQGRAGAWGVGCCGSGLHTRACDVLIHHSTMSNGRATMRHGMSNQHWRQTGMDTPVLDVPCPCCKCAVNPVATNRPTDKVAQYMTGTTNVGSKRTEVSQRHHRHNPCGEVHMRCKLQQRIVAGK